MHKYKFKTGFVTSVPTECLIEDYKILNNVFNRLDDPDLREQVGCVMDCISDTIDQYTNTDETGFKPSASSCVAMDCEDGVVVNADGSDVRCAAGKNISEAIIGGCCQCSEECQQKHYCYPEQGNFVLEGNISCNGLSSDFLDD